MGVVSEVNEVQCVCCQKVYDGVFFGLVFFLNGKPEQTQRQQLRTGNYC